ncbi:MAG TPA: hypothetical protein VEQ59_02225, partial [Polyangiaceae bacterium]|nr:hypothetical protein [Polyangiaceae bacterium]
MTRKGHHVQKDCGIAGVIEQHLAQELQRALWISPSADQSREFGGQACAGVRIEFVIAELGFQRKLQIRTPPCAAQDVTQAIEDRTASVVGQILDGARATKRQDRLLRVLDGVRRIGDGQ